MHESRLAWGASTSGAGRRVTQVGLALLGETGEPSGPAAAGTAAPPGAPVAAVSPEER